MSNSIIEIVGDGSNKSVWVEGTLLGFMREYRSGNWSGTTVDVPEGGEVYVQAGAAIYLNHADGQVNVSGTVGSGSAATARAINLGSANGTLTISESGVVTSGVRLAGRNAEFSNSGAVKGFVLVPGSRIEMVNSGEIKGEVRIGSKIGTTFSNTGLIEGAIKFWTSERAAEGVTVTNSGEISGEITFGESDDSFQGKGGSLDGELYAGGGADSLWMGRSNDKAYGDGGTDFIAGGGGADTLFGGRGP